jgi:hypothetical protein
VLDYKFFWPGLLGTLAMATTYWQVFGYLLGGSVLVHYGIYLCLFILLLPIFEWIRKQVQ